MTYAAVMARGAPFVDASEDGGAADGHDAIIEIPGQCVAKILLDAGHLHRRQKFAVGKLRQSFSLPANSGEFLDVVIPRSDIRVANRPIDGDAFLGVGLKIEIAPTIGLAAPGDGLAANLTSFYPGKMFSGFAGVRIIRVLNKKLVREFVAGVV